MPERYRNKHGNLVMYHMGALEFWVPYVGSVTITHHWPVELGADTVASEFLDKAKAAYAKMVPRWVFNPAEIGSVRAVGALANTDCLKTEGRITIDGPRRTIRY